MKRLNLIAALLGTALIASLTGCGSDNRESSASAQFVASQACIACHSGTVSPVTGNSIVTEYLKSAHSTVAGGAGCNDCHNVGDHPGNGALPAIPNNTVCVTCHTAKVAMSTQSAHFGTISTASYTGLPLARLANGLVNPATGDPSSSSCNGCHNPHDMTSLLSVNKQWAQSAHGAISDVPFNEQAFIKSTSCNRCHSGTGFRYYMNNNKTAITAAVLGKYSSAREAIGCSACHVDYSWKRITGLATFTTFSTPYTRSSTVGGTISKAFPTNVGDTGLCIPCHAGRNGGGAVQAITNPANASLPTPHYLAAAGMMYLKSAFINFTTLSATIGTSTYAKSLTSSDDISGGVTSTHRKLGTTAINGDSHNPSFFVPGNLDSNGPCVTCHMTAGHTLQIDGPTYTKVCSNCHTSEGGTPLTADNFRTVFLDPQSEAFQNTLSYAKSLLSTRYKITYDPANYPYLYDQNAGNAAVKDWTRGGTLTNASAIKLMGAAYNILLIDKEPAAYVHARTYTRRLLYDTIDFLDDGVMNLSSGAKAVINQPTVFGKGATAYTDGTLTTLAPGTTESMVYLLNFSRSTGAWVSPERP